MTDPDPLDRDALGAVPGSRRDFLKKMAAVAFATPVISVFTMDAVAMAGERGPRHRHPNQTYPNQTYPNQTHPNQTECGPRQHHPNQTYQNQTFPGHPYRDRVV